MILGSTGSIGTQTLDVMERHPERFEVVGLAAGNNKSLVMDQIRRFHPQAVSLARADDVEEIRREFPKLQVFSGEDGATRLVQSLDSDLVISAIVGAAGLKPTLEALDRGVSVALANKESLVIAGFLMTEKAREKGASLVPIDSEHSAIFQALAGNRREDIRRLILTASGGPFLNKSIEFLKTVTVDQALAHPKWKMGAKITIDSATLMNKGLEVIEASWFFGVPADRVDVHVHPQSLVHSLVEYRDGSVMAQLGVPDMRCAIAYAMTYPERIDTGVSSLNLLEAGRLDFYPPDFENFPCLKLAYEVARQGQTYPAVLNAANEEAVGKFLRKEVAFLEIPEIVSEVLNRHVSKAMTCLEDVLEADRWARQAVQTRKVYAA